MYLLLKSKSIFVQNHQLMLTPWGKDSTNGSEELSCSKTWKIIHLALAMV